MTQNRVKSCWQNHLWTRQIIPDIFEMDVWCLHFAAPLPFLVCFAIIHHCSCFKLPNGVQLLNSIKPFSFLLHSFSVVLIVILIMSEKRRKTQVALTLQQRSEIVRLCDAQVNFAICEHNSCDIQSRMFVYSLFHRFSLRWFRCYSTDIFVETDVIFCFYFCGFNFLLSKLFWWVSRTWKDSQL